MAAILSPQLQAVGETTSNDAGEQPPPLTGYSSCFKTSANKPSKDLKLKEVKLVHGEPTITFDSSDIAAYIKDENLQYALIAKFSYGKPEMADLRKIFPQQMGVKGECNLGFLDSRHILVRLVLHEDFISLYSRMGTSTLLLNNGKGGEFPFRIQKWTPSFNPKQETSIALAWISFPSLPVQLFAREALFSLASAIGNPIGVDRATNSQSRPSVARVKVEVDLLSSLPERIRIFIKEDGVDEPQQLWQKVVYDSLPSYCRTCYHQGHKDEVCRRNVDQQTLITNSNEGEKFQGDLRDKLKDRRKNQVTETTDPMKNPADQMKASSSNQTSQQTTTAARKQIGIGAGNKKPNAAVVGKKVYVPRRETMQQHSNGTLVGHNVNELHGANGTAGKIQNNVPVTGDNAAIQDNETTGQPNSVENQSQDQQNKNEVEGTNGDELVVVEKKTKTDVAGKDGWTVVTRRKQGRSYNGEQSVQHITDQQLQQQVVIEPASGIVNGDLTEKEQNGMTNVTQSDFGQQYVDTAVSSHTIVELVKTNAMTVNNDQIDSRKQNMAITDTVTIAPIIQAITDHMQQDTAVLSLADEVVRTMDEQNFQKSGKHNIVDVTDSVPINISSGESPTHNAAIPGKQQCNNDISQNKGDSGWELINSTATNTLNQKTVTGKGVQLPAVNELAVSAVDSPPQNQSVPKQIDYIGVQVLASLNSNIAVNDSWISKFGQNKNQIQSIRAPIQTSPIPDNFNKHQPADTQEHENQQVGDHFQTELNDIPSLISPAAAELIETPVEQDSEDELDLAELFDEGRQEHTVTIGCKPLSPNAPSFLPSNYDKQKQDIGASSTGQLESNVADMNMQIGTENSNSQKIISMDEDLLNALVSSTAITPINTNRQLEFPTTGIFSPNMHHGIEMFEEGEEEDILDTCYRSAARDADISPTRQRKGKNKNKRNKHCRKYSWEDEDFVPIQRQLPMRMAKQKMVGPTSSTKPNRSKNNI